MRSAIRRRTNRKVNVVATPLLASVGDPRSIELSSLLRAVTWVDARCGVLYTLAVLRLRETVSITYDWESITGARILDSPPGRGRMIQRLSSAECASSESKSVPSACCTVRGSSAEYSTLSTSGSVGRACARTRCSPIRYTVSMTPRSAPSTTDGVPLTIYLVTSK